MRFGSDDKKNDVVGVTQFLVKHITLKVEKEKNRQRYLMDVKFIGKDSIPYEKIHTIPENIYLYIQ